LCGVSGQATGRTSKDWVTADSIRTELVDKYHVHVEDTENGPFWTINGDKNERNNEKKRKFEA